MTGRAADGTTPDAAIVAFVRASRLATGAGEPRFTRLTGGVSSDIWLVETAAGRFCVKRALARLRVAADWQAPVERSLYEAEWLKSAHRVLPDAVPRVLADDPETGMLAMEYLPRDEYRLWKAELMAGRVDVAVASEVGSRLGRIHAAFARDQGAPERFPREDIFWSIRLEPYLEATGTVHPGLAGRLGELARRTAATRLTVVHGDVSPKNILVGPRGPVFLDAECAWFGDPAFDLAFCLNHLLLKCLASPPHIAAFLEAFDALRSAYVAVVDWEPPADVERRAATLLPGLLLARVDGKSPVEYIEAEADKDLVRRVAAALLVERQPGRLAEVRDAWAAALGAGAKGGDDGHAF